MATSLALPEALEIRHTSAAMPEHALVERMRHGDSSAFLSWAPTPLEEAAVDELWSDARAHGPEIPTLFYAHIPHCVSSCNFCMYFHRVTQSADTHRATVDHIVARLQRFRQRSDRVTIAAGYVGGGTPTAMPIAMLVELLEEVHRNLDFVGPLTVEAHPGTTEPSAIASLARVGVTRVSMGLQSLERSVLVTITRRNPSLEHVAALLRACQQSGVESNVDLVVGLPGQRRSSFVADLERLIALRPDAITLYRYIPTRKLAGGTLKLEDALDVNQWRTWTRAGYLGRLPHSGANSVVLLRANRHLRRRLARTVRAFLHPEALVGHYEAFGDSRKHLLGFGPGAIGHIWGRAWLREITSLSRIPGPSIYTGTRLTPFDEARAALRRRFTNSKPIPAERLARDAGVTVEELLTAENDALRSALIKLGPWRVPRPGLSEARREELLRQWTPPKPELSSAWTHELLERTEQELTPLRFEIGSSDLVDEFRAALGIPGKGLRWEGALIVERDDTGLAVAVGHKQAAPLRLLIEDPEHAPRSYVSTRRFALSYSAGDRSLTADERAFVDMIAARLREVDGADSAT